MAWMTLALRKQSLKPEIAELNYEDLQLSRRKRSLHRHLAHDKAAYNAAMKAELAEVKGVYMDVRNERPEDIKSDDYQKWSADYSEAKEDFEAYKADIKDYYDDLNEEIETEAQDEEDLIDDEITRVETQRDARNEELQSITDQVKAQIEADALKF